MKKNKEQIKKKIVQFLKGEYKKTGIVPSGRTIYEKLGINIWYYFKKGLKKFTEFADLNFLPRKINRDLEEDFIYESAIE